MEIPYLPDSPDGSERISQQASDIRFTPISLSMLGLIRISYHSILFRLGIIDILSCSDLITHCQTYKTINHIHWKNIQKYNKIG